VTSVSQQRIVAGSRRSDSWRNRDAILRVAAVAFTSGPDVAPMHEIARRVGLGRSTVYRHFPDQEALAQAVATQQIDALRRALEALFAMVAAGAAAAPEGPEDRVQRQLVIEWILDGLFTTG
jgi:AcrR family transcriptional regulator